MRIHIHQVDDPGGEALAIVLYILRGPSAMKQIEESEAPMMGFWLYRSEAIGEDAREKKQE